MRSRRYGGVHGDCICGTRLRSGFGICFACIKETANRPKQIKRAKQCKGCDKVILKKCRKTKFCSSKCKSAYFESQRIQAACDNCGATLVLRRCETACKRKYCNANCQRAHQASGAWKSSFVSIALGRRLKARLKKTNSKKRRSKSVQAEWWSTCSRAAINDENFAIDSEISRWHRRCVSAASMVNRRKAASSRCRAANQFKTWNLVCSENVRLTYLKEKSLWSQRIDNARGNAVKRFVAKYNNGIGNNGLSKEEIQEKLQQYLE